MVSATSSPALSHLSNMTASTSATRPGLDRMPSTYSDTPVATNSVVNKVASASSSLYQNCRRVLDRLERVPGFDRQFINAETSSSSSTTEPSTSTPLDTSSIASDPVSRSLHILRLGSSLCYLFNALGLEHRLEVNPLATMSNLKACQRGTAHFVMACKQHLKWPDQDLFAIHELYGQDTNGVVKVIHTVTKVLDRLEQQGVLLAPKLEAEEAPLANAGPSDERTMIVREILDSERKYVQDLEVLQDYQRQVQANDIITQDQIHNLFLNLNTLADFQRRFLIGVEANASRPPEEQRFGHLFLSMEEHFSVYEPYCANLTAAQDLAMAENAALSKLSHVLDPVSELAPLLIKPVQRLCKYPLLIGTLVKNTPETTPHYAELQAGHAAIMRVTDRVNETKRREDNRQTVLDLASRVEDWKGHDINSFGELLLHETFFVVKNDSEREYHVYLFERIILCCKESTPNTKKNSKSNSIIKKPNARKPTTLLLKGRIFVNNVTGTTAMHRNGQCLLEVRWRGDVAEEAFTIKCRTDELLKQWQKAIMRAVEEAPIRRRQNHLSAGRRSERSLNSPMSQFPATPMNEMGPNAGASAYPYGNDSSPYLWQQQGSNSHHASYSNLHSSSQSNGFDDDHDEQLYYNGEQSESGRSTPNHLGGIGTGGPRRTGPSTRSLPAEHRNGNPVVGQHGAGGAADRPRAQTENSSSAVINQWRSQTPNLPSRSSSQAGDDPSLRGSASSRQLRSKQSSDWSGGGYPRAPSGQGYHGQSSQDDDSTPRQYSAGASQHMNRQGSYGQTANGYPQAPPLIRNRSASSPNMYQQPQFAPGPSPQLQDSEWASSTSSRTQNASSASHPYAYASSSSTNVNGSGGGGHKAGATNSGGTLASQSSTSTRGAKRFSSSSNHTDRSSATSNTSAGGGLMYSSNGTSPATSAVAAGSHPPLPSSTGFAASNHSAAIRVKVTYGEDTFVVVVLASVTYRELLEKVLKKIKLCGRSLNDANSLRLRYQDEDGDRILITSDEDVGMAIGDLKMTAGGNAQNLTLILFASVDA